MKWLERLFGADAPVQPEHVETAADFERVVRRSPLPVVLYVWSDTCQPCKRMAPEIVAAATRHRDRVRFAEVSASGADPRLLGELGIRATPTLVVFQGGEELGRMSGFRPRAWFDEMIAAEFG